MLGLLPLWTLSQGEDRPFPRPPLMSCEGEHKTRPAPQEEGCLSLTLKVGTVWPQGSERVSRYLPNCLSPCVEFMLGFTSGHCHARYWVLMNEDRPPVLAFVMFCSPPRVCEPGSHVHPRTSCLFLFTGDVLHMTLGNPGVNRTWPFRNANSFHSEVHTRPLE